MDATKCKICGKREWNHACKGGTESAEPARKKKPARPKPATNIPKNIPRESGDPLEFDARVVGIEGLLARVESLEARVLELEARKKYMKDYMARKREKEKSAEKGEDSDGS